MKKTKATPIAFIHIECFDDGQGGWNETTVGIEGRHSHLIELLGNVLDKEPFCGLMKEAIMVRIDKDLKDVELMLGKKAKA